VFGKSERYDRLGRPSIGGYAGVRLRVGATGIVVATILAATVTAGGAARAAVRTGRNTTTAAAVWPGRIPARGLRDRPRIRLAAGKLHTCVIGVNSGLWCWGRNLSGELGIGNNTDQQVPRQVTTPAATGWATIAAGGDQTCGVRVNSTLWCWGDNERGQLGIGNTIDQNVPRQVTTPSARGWTTLTAGTGNTCAVRADSTLWCWGSNDAGELGIGNNISQNVPRQVTTPAAAGWTAVTARGANMPGIDHTCAVRADGTLWCWGFDGLGQLGIGSTADQDIPRQVTTLSGRRWTAVSAGTVHTCALRAGHALWCWGNNTYGQLGIGNTTDEDVPQPVTTPAATGWDSIATGGVHTCALRAGHALWCWGNNTYGQLGIGNTTDEDVPQPVTTPAATGWDSIAGGYRYTCALRAGHALWCWGNNTYGQLGIGNTTDQDVPQRVTTPAAVGW
jgi:alpha-tubulin suppressor-like RCC1 family protein